MEKYLASLLPILVVVMVATSWTSADEMGTNFFLKASKSVPRIGRRGDVDFLKASKSVPRIGRRRGSEFPLRPNKRYYSEKDIGESGDIWGYDPSMMQQDDPYANAEDYQYDYQDQYQRSSPHKRSHHY